MRTEINILIVAGYLIIAFWLTHLSYLFPTPSQDSFFEGVNKLITGLYEDPETNRYSTLLEGKSKEEVIKEIRLSSYMSWAQYLAVVIAGIISGILITKQKKLGRRLP